MRTLPPPLKMAAPTTSERHLTRDISRRRVRRKNRFLIEARTVCCCGDSAVRALDALTNFPADDKQENWLLIISHSPLAKHKGVIFNMPAKCFANG